MTENSDRLKKKYFISQYYVLLLLIICQINQLKLPDSIEKLTLEDVRSTNREMLFLTSIVIQYKGYTMEKVAENEL